ncbi:MAG TPA: hypothetical protein VFT99_03760 [Roseiflexaceae bacterium]|nr:hypothetical protein [Roseiflexaceae bacterium]
MTTTHPQPARLIAQISALALALIALTTMPRIGSIVRQIAVLLRSPFPNDALEGTLLYEAGLVRAGQALYQPLQPDRFVSAPYPPLHAAAVALTMTLPGPGVFWGGRLVSAAGMLVIAGCILAIVALVGRAWPAGLIGATLFAGSGPAMLWATRIKPDMLAIGLAMLGLGCVVMAAQREQRAGQRAWLLASGVACFTLAWFTRQTTVVAAIASAVGLALNDALAYRSGQHAALARVGGRTLPLRADTMAFLVALAVCNLGGWALADLITAGQYSAHVWGLHQSEWWSLYLVGKYARLLAPFWPALLLVIPLIYQARSDPAARVLCCYVVLAPFTLLGAAEISANHNHLLESHVAIGLATGMGASWAIRVAPRPGWLPAGIIALALVVMQLLLTTRPQAYYMGELRPHDTPERFVHYIRNTPGEILADDVGLLIAGGKPVRYDDPSTMGPAARWGIWDQRGLLQEIAEKRFSAILLADDVNENPYDGVGRWTREMRAAIRDNYQLKFRDRIRVYVPKD